MIAGAFALSLLVPRAARAAAGISALDIIELQIVYTTILARYYRNVAPRTLVDGARTGIGAELEGRGIDATLPYARARLDLYDGGDAIDAMVLRTLARYGARVDAHALVTAAIAGELGTLHDPYSVLFRPPQFERFNAFLGNAPTGGIGAIISLDAATRRPAIDRVLAGGAAERAGLRAGDELVAIDGRDTQGEGAETVRDSLRGKIGSTLHVSFVRGGVPQDVALVRAAIHDPEVTERTFGAVGYLGLTRFGDRAGDEIADDLAELRAHGANAYVLDLRGNGGGYGDEATAVASSFIASGPIFTTRERGGARTVSRATGKRPPFSAPLVVLVDGDTASAAEIVAGAVQDDRAGTIMGTRTFGKGVAQSIFPLPDGSAFKLTTARYTTPAGRDLDGAGIVPDVVVPEPPGAVLGDPATDPQLASALARLSPTPAAPAPPNGDQRP